MLAWCSGGARRGASRCRGWRRPDRSAPRGRGGGIGGSRGQLLHKQEAPVFARQTPQRRAPCAGGQSAAGMSPLPPRSIPHPPPAPPLQPAPRRNRACRPAHSEWRRGPNMAPCVGAGGRRALPPSPGPPPPPAPRPAPRRRCRPAQTRRLIQLCLISKWVLERGGEGGGAAGGAAVLRPRGSRGAGQPLLVPPCSLPAAAAALRRGRRFTGSAAGAPCWFPSRCCGRLRLRRLWRSGAGEPPSGLRAACPRARPGPQHGPGSTGGRPCPSLRPGCRQAVAPQPAPVPSLLVPPPAIHHPCS